MKRSHAGDIYTHWKKQCPEIFFCNNKVFTLQTFVIHFSTPCHASGELQGNMIPSSCLDLYCGQTSYQKQRQQRAISEDRYWTQTFGQLWVSRWRWFFNLWEEMFQMWASACHSPHTHSLERSSSPWRHHSPHSFVINHTHSCCISLSNIILTVHRAARESSGRHVAHCLTSPYTTLQMQMTFI